jgi:NodT family efflux transporter outer membrane factor (OMF) lipoprotein
MRHPSPARLTAIALMASTGVGLLGCSAGPSFTRPALTLPERYTAEAGAQQIELGREIEGEWWALFGSEPMKSIVDEALERNRSLSAASAALAEARENLSAVAGTRYPELAMTAGVGRQKYGDEFLGGFFKLPAFTYFAIGPTLSYQLDYTGGVKRSIERQAALAERARDELDAAYLSVTGEAILQALSIAARKAQLATLESLIVEDEHTLQLVQTALDEGSVPRADLVTARSQLASDRTRLPPLRQELARARHALALVLGKSAAEPQPPDLDLDTLRLPAALPVSLPSELVHRRPDILAAEAELHAATSAVGMAASNLYPKITLSGSLGQQSNVGDQLFNRGNDAWSLLGGLTAPLFDGGTLRAEHRRAEAALRASTARYQQTVLEAFRQVADALDALGHDAEELDAQTEARAAAQSNLEFARASYAEGAGSILRVIDAERQLEQSRLGYVQAVAQRYLDTVELFVALGGTSPVSSGALSSGEPLEPRMAVRTGVDPGTNVVARP